jgi:hypothetical protein
MTDAETASKTLLGVKGREGDGTVKQFKGGQGIKEVGVWSMMKMEGSIKLTRSEYLNWHRSTVFIQNDIYFFSR